MYLLIQFIHRFLKQSQSITGKLIFSKQSLFSRAYIVGWEHEEYNNVQAMGQNAYIATSVGKVFPILF
jgi:hypothetical protein